jgi:co-chaperonin GroES (HSP10)
LRHVPNWTPQLEQIRPNRLLIRPFQPKGLTPGGIYLERNEKHPPTWGHVLATAENIPEHYSIEPGVMILFTRYAEETLYTEPLQNYTYPGEEGAVAIIHVNAVEAVITPSLFEVPI